MSAIRELAMDINWIYKQPNAHHINREQTDIIAHLMIYRFDYWRRLYYCRQNYHLCAEDDFYHLIMQ
jgi:hypothetical protein